VGQITRRIDNLDFTKGRAAGLSLHVCSALPALRSGHTHPMEGSICGCRGRQDRRHDGCGRQHLVSHCLLSLAMGMRNYLIEGVSGTGKTSVCKELQRRGYYAINGDTELAYQGDPGNR
jgi:Cdc6-like AAA superfamily ATPase